MISVVIPTRESSPDLEECLRSLKNQTKKAGEIIVVFDSKKDKNVNTAKKYGARIVFDTNGTIGGAYYIGAKTARGGIIAFMDDDCTAPSGWIEKLEKEFEEDVDIVSGEDALPENSSFFQRAAYQIDKARTMGNAAYGEKAKNRLRAANIAYRKKIFEKDNFNPRLKGLQEPEFHHRLFKKGFKTKFNPQLIVYHKRRNSLLDIFNQIYRNGKAKIQVIKIHREMISFIDVFPFIYAFFSLLMAYFSLTTHTWTFFKYWLLVTLLYFVTKPLVIVVKTREIKYYPHLFLIVLVREIAYSLGIIAGLKGVFKR